VDLSFYLDENYALKKSDTVCQIKLSHLNLNNAWLRV